MITLLIIWIASGIVGAIPLSLNLSRLNGAYTIRHALLSLLLVLFGVISLIMMFAEFKDKILDFKLWRHR